MVIMMIQMEALGGRGLCLMRRLILQGLVSRPKFLKGIVVASKTRLAFGVKEDRRIGRHLEDEGALFDEEIWFP
jgi:hypothetical protein